MTGAWPWTSCVVFPRPGPDKGPEDCAGQPAARDWAHTVVMTGSCFQATPIPWTAPRPGVNGLCALDADGALSCGRLVAGAIFRRNRSGRAWRI